MMQPWGSYVAIVGFVILTLINGFNVFWPKNWSVSSFMTAYVGIPIFLVIYFGHRIYARNDPWAHPPELVDMHTGMEEVLAEEEPKHAVKTKLKWYKQVNKLWE